MRTESYVMCILMIRQKYVRCQYPILDMRISCLVLHPPSSFSVTLRVPPPRFLDFWPVLTIFWFLGFLCIFWIILDFFDFFLLLIFFCCWFFYFFWGFFSKLLRLLLKFTKVTTGHQKSSIMGQNSMVHVFFCLKGKNNLGRRPKPFAGARSRPA